VGPGFSPLDETLGLAAQTAFTPRLIEGMVRLGTALPFEQVPDLLAFFTGVQVSAATVRRWTEAAGAVRLAQDTVALADLVQRLPDPPPGPARQQLSADGVFVPLVDGEWAEVKTLVIGHLADDASPGDQHATDLSYQACLADAASFGWQATLETHRRGTATAALVVAVLDGADWLQGFVDLQRPDAVRILDFAHALGHLGQVAQAVFGTGTAAASAWLGEQAHALRHGDPATVVADLADLAGAVRSGVQPTVAPEAAAVVHDCLRYLGTRLDQIQYATFTAAGYPVGSGIVESANKLLVEARLKGSGMRWARPNVNCLLVLRCLERNGRWAEGWTQIWPGLRQRQTPSPPPPMRATPPPRVPAPGMSPSTARPARPKTIVNGKPTADHPWRRSSPFRAKC
jgi:hypothetical protein